MWEGRHPVVELLAQWHPRVDGLPRDLKVLQRDAEVHGGVVIDLGESPPGVRQGVAQRSARAGNGSACNSGRAGEEGWVGGVPQWLIGDPVLHPVSRTVCVGGGGGQ